MKPVDKKEYLSFIASLSSKFGPIFKDVWWGSLIHEKNPNKSRSIHILLKGLAPEPVKYSTLKALGSAVRAWVSLLYLRYIFGSAKLSVNSMYLVYHYGRDHLDFFLQRNYMLSSQIVFPQKANYRDILERCRRYGSNTHCIYSFISWWELIRLPFTFLNVVRKYLRYRKELYGRINERLPGAGAILKHDISMSFFGATAVQSLAYSYAMRRIDQQKRSQSTNIFVYEGLGWEKILCRNLRGEKIGVVCSASPDNYLSFFYSMLDPVFKPNKLMVMGEAQKKQFKKYHFNVQVYGAGRYSYLVREKIKRSEVQKDEPLVVLGYNKSEAEDLLGVLGRCNSGVVSIVPHPLSIPNRNSNKPLRELLLKHRWVIMTGDTTALYDALAAGCFVAHIELPNYLSMAPDFISVIRGEIDFKRFLITMRTINRLSGKCTPSMRFIKKYFEDASDKEMVERILS